MKILKKLVVLAINICLLSLWIFAQSKKGSNVPDKPFEVRTNLRVLDLQGALVNDLQIGDVKLFEDEVEQKLTYFARKDPGVSLALVVDNSGSMRTQLPILTALGKTLVRALNQSDRLTVIRFISSDKIEVLEPWTSDKASAVAAIDLMYIEGGASAVIDAVFLAAGSLKKEQGAGGSKRFAAVMLSDFEDSESYYTLDQALELIPGSDIQVFPFALTSQSVNRVKKENAEKLAHTLAVRTGGTAYVIDGKITPDLLAAKLTALLIELRSQYVLGYVPLNQKRNTTRNLRLEISDGPKGEKRRGQVRENYLLPKD